MHTHTFRRQPLRGRTGLRMVFRDAGEKEGGGGGRLIGRREETEKVRGVKERERERVHWKRQVGEREVRLGRRRERKRRERNSKK